MDLFDSTTTIKEAEEFPTGQNYMSADNDTNTRKHIRLFFANLYPEILPFTKNEKSNRKRISNEIPNNRENPKIIKIDQKYEMNKFQIQIPDISVNRMLDSSHNIDTEYFVSSGSHDLKYNESYSNYQPTYLKIGKQHPFPIVESRSLATIKSPKIRYSLKLPNTIIDKGVLSNVQLEAVIYACQRHTAFLRDNKRAGFLVGDGAGVGKGRTAAAIILENYLMGRKKAIWLSVSNDLKEDAIRDLEDIGKDIGIQIEVKSLNKMSYKRIHDYFDEGVLFITYSSLISTCKQKGLGLFKTRFDQIVDWFGATNDGVVVLDECHKAKENTTKTGISVVNLQQALVNARIVYASATGASEPKHMAYMVRLGLWGPGTPFLNFDAYKNTLVGLGVGAMELIAMELKMKGVYLSRQLNFENVQFEIREAQIENSTINGYKFEYVYNQCVELWEIIYKEFLDALNRNNIGSAMVIIQSQFWASHQRFFKYLCISAKIQECIKIVTKEIQSGKCVVIGLQSTGEARTMSELGENLGELSEYVSTAAGVLKSLIEQFYPSIENLKKMKDKKRPRKNDGKCKSPIENVKEIDNFSIYSDIINLSDDDSDCAIVDSETNMENKENIFDKFLTAEFDKDLDINGLYNDNFETQTSYYAKPKRYSDKDFKNNMRTSDFSLSSSAKDDVKMQALLQKVKDIKCMLPVNVLDELIHELGGPNYVAEMTGRKGRMVEESGNISYKSRKESGIYLDQINLQEKDRFNNGEKLIAIISDSASIGISLHSDKRFLNQCQRVHLTLELPWSADKAVQQFGRTHRSNQVLPPHYIFLISDLAGEKRFAATVAKRLETLGALTHGDRRCVDKSDLSQFNLDNEFGIKALGFLISHIFKAVPSEIPYPSKYLSMYNNNCSMFRNMAAKALRGVGIDGDSKMTVTKFLNRILGIKLDMQNALFQYFSDIVEYVSEIAKSRNEFDHGIRDVESGHDSFSLIKSNCFDVDTPKSNDKIIVNKVKIINKGVTYKNVVKKYVYDATANMFCVSKGNSIRLLAFAECQKNNNFKIITPNFPEKIIRQETFYKMYGKIDFQASQELWEYIYRESENKCLHVIGEQNCAMKNCTFGKRIKFMHIITGSVVLALKKISLALPNVKLEIIRIKLNDGSKLIGGLIPENEYTNIISIFNGDFKKPLTKSKRIK